MSRILLAFFCIRYKVKYRSRNNRIRRRIALAVCAAAAAALLVCIHLNVTGLLAAVAEAKLRARAQEAADQAVLQTFAGAASYDDLVTVSRNGAGEIESIAADTPTINRLARLAAQRMQSILSAACEEGIAIPLGAFTGIGAWAGFGPDVTMKIVSASAVTGRFFSSFTGAGINQTRHAIMLELTASLSVIIPGRSYDFTAASEVLVAESVLVGKVPEIYFGR